MNLDEIIIVNLIGIVLLLNILIGSRTRLMVGMLENKLQFSIIMICMGGCLADILVWVTDGKKGAFFYWITMLGNTYLYLANIVIGVFWIVFLDLHFYKDADKALKKLRYLALSYSVLILILLINIRIPIVFRIREDYRYERLPFSMVYFAVAAAAMLYSWIFYRMFQRKSGKQRFMFVGLFLAPTVAAAAFQMLFYGYSLIWTGIAVGLAGASMALHNEYAYQDSLTGLYNREFLDYYLLSASRKKNSDICGMMIDADDFKSINDNYGHSEGDEALVNIARLLRLSLVEGSTAFRYAGDEFIILSDSGSRQDLEQIGRNLEKHLKEYNEKSQKPYQLSLSAGIAATDLTRHTVDEFQKQMDMDMYHNKRERKHSH